MLQVIIGFARIKDVGSLKKKNAFHGHERKIPLRGKIKIIVD